ncbi:MAG: CvpA family protein [Cyclobacteriaceae bacterium]|nr:CvpA family protein [Cyclobacteriaceae bacterium]
MSKFDIAVAIVLLMGAILGYKRGFLLELFFLIALILGVFIGFKLMSWGVEFLAQKFNADTAVLPYISFALIFIIVVVVVNFIGGRIKNSIDKTFLGKMDSAAGAVLGLLKYAFSISILLWLVDSFKISLPESWVGDSKIYPLVAQVAPTIASFFGDFLPFFKETFSQF